VLDGGRRQHTVSSGGGVILPEVARAEVNRLERSIEADMLLKNM